MPLAAKPRNPNQSTLLIGVLLLLISVVGVYQFFAPQLRATRTTLAQRQAELKGKEDDIAALTQAKEQILAARTAFTQTYGLDFDKLTNTYPLTEDMPGLYLQFESLMTQARDLGITNPLYQIGVPQLDTTDNAVRIPVGVSAIGNYLTLKDFVGKLEHNLRPLSIQSINFAQGLDKDKGTPSGQFTMNMSGFVRAEGISSAFATAK